MTAVLHDKKSLDDWWASLPEITEHVSEAALTDQHRLEAELLEMAGTMHLLGNARRQFVRTIVPSTELRVSTWGGVLRRLKGHGFAKASSHDGSEWLAQVSTSVWAVFRKGNNGKSHSVSSERNVAAVVSRTALESLVEAEVEVIPSQILAELRSLFKKVSSESKYDQSGSVFSCAPLKFEVTFDENGTSTLEMPRDTSHDFGIKLISPTPTVMPFADGGLIVGKRDFSLPLGDVGPRDFAALAWIPDGGMPIRMAQIRHLWRERLNNPGLWKPGYDPDLIRSLTLETTG